MSNRRTHETGRSLRNRVQTSWKAEVIHHSNENYEQHGSVAMGELRCSLVPIPKPGRPPLKRFSKPMAERFGVTDVQWRESQALAWDEEIAANTELFRQADALDEAAYRIIQYDRGSAEAWTRFSEAKAIADAKRTAAYQDWMRIKRAMRN
jgi:hypothetical protein